MKTSTAGRLEWQAPTTVTVPEVEPEPQDLAECLAGPNGQELVVEMAHDLRSPLTAILFLAESLQNAENGPVTDSQRRTKNEPQLADRKSTRLNSSHSQISYAVFCLKKKKKKQKKQ